MDFQNAQQLDMLAQDLVWADWRRGINRALILSLANGNPPFTDEEAESAKVKTNVNDLTHTSLLHDARTQYANGFFQQGQYLTCRTDWAPKHKRDIYSRIIEAGANKPLLDSVQYFESLRSKFGLLVLHGIGPSVWKDSYSLIPKPISVADLLVPTNTELGFDNLPFIYLRKSFTAMELEKLTLSAKRDPGWNMELVKRCLKWVDQEMRGGLDSTYNQYYKPEKWEEESKQEAGWYMADRVPTIDVFDIYAYVESTASQPAGWVRRIILDSWSNPGVSPGPNSSKPERRSDRGDLDTSSKDNFLFSSNSKPVAETWQNIVSVQYADLSAGFPAMHNSVRSLGWLTYAQCHIGNRLKCRFYDSVFEALMQYFQVSSMDDVQRAMKLELANTGFIDDTIQPVKAQDRWQPNSQLIELGLGQNAQDIASHSKSFTQNPDASNSRTEKTKFQYMAELQRMNALVAAGLNQAYTYQKFEDREIFRRLLIPGSKDPLVRRFRENCLRQGVPEKLLNSPEAWDVQHEKMMGQGNQTLEMMVAEELMKLAPGLDPEPQRVVKRNFVTSLTHNPQMAIELVPETPNQNPPAAQQAGWDATQMLKGIPVQPATGINHVEYCEAMLKILGERIQAGQKKGGMVAPDELQGMKLMANSVAEHLKILEEDPSQKPVVKKLQDVLTKMGNMIRAFEQRLMAAAKKQQQQGQQNGDGGKQAAKVAAPIIMAKTKAAIKAAEAKQKLAHKDAQFKQQLTHEAIRAKADIAKTDLVTAADIKRKRMFEESEDDAS